MREEKYILWFSYTLYIIIRYIIIHVLTVFFFVLYKIYAFWLTINAYLIAKNFGKPVGIYYISLLISFNNIISTYKRLFILLCSPLISADSTSG